MWSLPLIYLIEDIYPVCFLLFYSRCIPGDFRALRGVVVSVAGHETSDHWLV